MPPLKLGAFKKSPEQLAALARVKLWTRERFELAEEIPVLASELACNRPGCAPLETLVAFWTADGERHHFKIFKPVEAVVPDDLPSTWLADALFTGAAGSCLCC